MANVKDEKKFNTDFIDIFNDEGNPTKEELKELVKKLDKRIVNLEHMLHDKDEQLMQSRIDHHAMVAKWHSEIALRLKGDLQRHRDEPR